MPLLGAPLHFSAPSCRQSSCLSRVFFTLQHGTGRRRYPTESEALVRVLYLTADLGFGSQRQMKGEGMVLEARV
jgi:hypothetical protein